MKLLFLIIVILAIVTLVLLFVLLTQSRKHKTSPLPSSITTPVIDKRKPGLIVMHERLKYLHTALFQTNEALIDSNPVTVSEEIRTSVSYVVAKLGSDISSVVIQPDDVTNNQVYEITYNLFQLSKCETNFIGEVLKTDDNKTGNMSAAFAVDILKTMREYGFYVPDDVMATCKKSDSIIYGRV